MNGGRLSCPDQTGASGVWSEVNLKRVHEPATNQACRFCAAGLSLSFVDLGMTPLANTYVPFAMAQSMEPYYPLHAYVCTDCWLVQLGNCAPPENIFDDGYSYFSSYSSSWLAHAEAFCRLAVDRFGLNESKQVVEIASNDGYLLQFFAQLGIPVHGIEPSGSVAEVAIAKGIPTTVAFLNRASAVRFREAGLEADLLVGNNVLAHVPDVNGFVAGMKTMLRPEGIITMEFPHLRMLVDNCQFDTIYHEHYSYFSMIAVDRIFRSHGLTIFDVDHLPTHGGSIRIYARHSESENQQVESSVRDLLELEHQEGYSGPEIYRRFSQRVMEAKQALRSFLYKARREERSVAAYGAPAKGNTLLNACGVGRNEIQYTVDRNPHKQGHFLPGSRIPVLHPDVIRSTRPDYLLVLPWNLCDEILEQTAYVREWGGRFVIPIPTVKVI